MVPPRKRDKEPDGYKKIRQYIYCINKKYIYISMYYEFYTLRNLSICINNKYISGYG